MGKWILLSSMFPRRSGKYDVRYIDGSEHRISYDCVLEEFFDSNNIYNDVIISWKINY